MDQDGTATLTFACIELYWLGYPCYCCITRRYISVSIFRSLLHLNLEYFLYCILLTLMNRIPTYKTSISRSVNALVEH